jgi:ribosomal protein S6
LRTYEAMFLLNPAVVPDWSAGEAEIRRILERAEASVLALVRWDERRLAYEIGGQKRGLYGLAYFQVDRERLDPLERDARLSEAVMRVLILKTEGLTPEKIEEIIAKASAAKHAPAEHPAPADAKGDEMDAAPSRTRAKRAKKMDSEEIPDLEAEVEAVSSEERN